MRQTTVMSAQNCNGDIIYTPTIRTTTKNLSYLYVHWQRESILSADNFFTNKHFQSLVVQFFNLISNSYCETFHSARFVYFVVTPFLNLQLDYRKQYTYPINRQIVIEWQVYMSKCLLFTHPLRTICILVHM